MISTVSLTGTTGSLARRSRPRAAAQTTAPSSSVVVGSVAAAAPRARRSRRGTRRTPRAADPVGQMPARAARATNSSAGPPSTRGPGEPGAGAGARQRRRRRRHEVLRSGSGSTGIGAGGRRRRRGREVGAGTSATPAAVGRSCSPGRSDVSASSAVLGGGPAAARRRRPVGRRHDRGELGVVVEVGAALPSGRRRRGSAPVGRRSTGRGGSRSISARACSTAGAVDVQPVDVGRRGTARSAGRRRRRRRCPRSRSASSRCVGRCRGRGRRTRDVRVGAQPVVRAPAAVRPVPLRLPPRPGAGRADELQRLPAKIVGASLSSVATW